MTRSFGPKAGLTTVLAIVVSLVTVPPASATHVQCGDVITQNATLDSSLVNCPGDGIVIAAGDVTLDLNRHTIDGMGAGSGVRVEASSPGATVDDIAVIHGTVQQFFDGIDLGDTVDPTVRAMTSQQNGDQGINGNWSNGMFVRDSIVRDNRGSGVTFANSDIDTRTGRVEHSLLQHNGESGVRADFSEADLIENEIVANHDHGAVFGAAGGQVVGNLIRGNGGDGVRTFDYGSAVITKNRIAGNGRNGIAINYGSSGGTIRDNTLSANDLDGLFVDPELAGDPVVERNRARDNGDDGLDIERAGALVRANRAFFNVDLGIEAEPGVLDGGGNRAKHNGDPAQCVGVRCR